MALGNLTKQIAQQALLSAATKEPAPPQQEKTENVSAVILAQIGAMQKALKEDEELVVLFRQGTERIRVTEIFAPSRQVLVLSGADAERNFTRVVCAVERLELTCKAMKIAPGGKPLRVGLVTPKS